MKLRASWALVALALPLVVAACGAQGGTGLTAADRTVYLAAIEPKGSTSVDKEPFPAAALPVGGGYGLEEPDADGKWTVETYRWLPGEITVVQGDKVTLEILGINGASHPTTIEGYDISFEVKRGQLNSVTFTADKPGIFRIICSAHQPSMTGQFIVLPSK